MVNDNSGWDLYNKIQRHEHRLNIVSSDEKNSSLALRHRGHQFQLPAVFTDLLFVKILSK